MSLTSPALAVGSLPLSHLGIPKEWPYTAVTWIWRWGWRRWSSTSQAREASWKKWLLKPGFINSDYLLDSKFIYVLPSEPCAVLCGGFVFNMFLLLSILLCLEIIQLKHTQEELFSLLDLPSSFLSLGGGAWMPNSGSFWMCLPWETAEEADFRKKVWEIKHWFQFQFCRNIWAACLMVFSWLKMTPCVHLTGTWATAGLTYAFPISICFTYILILSLLGKNWVRWHFGDRFQLVSCDFLSLWSSHILHCELESGPRPVELPQGWLQGKENSKWERTLFTCESGMCLLCLKKGEWYLKQIRSGRNAAIIYKRSKFSDWLATNLPLAHCHLVVHQSRICLQCRIPRETQVQSLGWEDPLKRAWQPTPVFLPGDSNGQRRLKGYSPWGCKELDTTEAT